MSTHAVRHNTLRGGLRVGVSAHWAWLAGGFVVAFAVPYLLAESRSAFGVVFEINRDLLYGMYALAVVALFALWSRSTGYDLVAAVRRWLVALVLGLAAAGVLAFMVVRTDDATARPDGLELIGAVAWRGILYGVTDGLLLSVFPILVVLAAFTGNRLNRHFAGRVAIGIIALFASAGLHTSAVLHRSGRSLSSRAGASRRSSRSNLVGAEIAVARAGST